MRRKNLPATHLLLYPDIRAAIDRLSRNSLPRPEQLRLGNQLWQLKQRAADAFARGRGWRKAQTSFSVRQLAKSSAGRHLGADYCGLEPWELFDHTEFFREPLRPYRPAAMVVHLYNFDEARDAPKIAQLGLRYELLPESWYNPGHCMALIYTRAPQGAKK